MNPADLNCTNLRDRLQELCDSTGETNKSDYVAQAGAQLNIETANYAWWQSEGVSAFGRSVKACHAKLAGLEQRFMQYGVVCPGEATMVGYKPLDKYTVEQARGFLDLLNQSVLVRVLEQHEALVDSLNERNRMLVESAAYQLGERVLELLARNKEGLRSNLPDFMAAEKQVLQSELQGSQVSLDEASEMLDLPCKYLSIRGEVKDWDHVAGDNRSVKAAAAELLEKDLPELLHRLMIFYPIDKKDKKKIWAEKAVLRDGIKSARNLLMKLQTIKTGASVQAQIKILDQLKTIYSTVNQAALPTDFGGRIELESFKVPGGVGQQDYTIVPYVSLCTGDYEYSVSGLAGEVAQIKFVNGEEGRKKLQITLLETGLQLQFGHLPANQLLSLESLGRIIRRINSL